MSRDPDQRIWKCPICASGRRAPEIMDQADVRRYCLGCSANSATLVQLICPALERESAELEARSTMWRAKRADTRRRQRERTAERAAKQAKERARVGRFALDELLVELVALEALGGKRSALARRPPKLAVRRATRPQHRQGAYWPDENRIQVNVWPGQSEEQAVSTLLGLIVDTHHYRYENGRGGRGREQWLLVQAMDEAWPDLDVHAAAHMQSWEIELALRLALARDGASVVDRPVQAPPTVAPPGAAHPLRGRRHASQARHVHGQTLARRVDEAHVRLARLLVVADRVAATRSAERARPEWQAPLHVAWRELSAQLRRTQQAQAEAGDASPTVSQAAALGGVNANALLRRSADDGTLAKVGLTLSAGALTLA